LKTLLIDNYDSFTYNLFQLLAEVNGVEPLVVRNDEASWDELAALDFDNVVISPGPGRPDRAPDFGVCADAIRESRAPLLGVCLGHQGLASGYGGEVQFAPEPMHGRLSRIRHTASALFAGIPSPFQAVRYHSLCIGQPLPETLAPTAWSDDGVVMALTHRSLPQWGVQFHPESVCTEHGRCLLQNFRDLSERFLYAESDERRVRRRGYPRTNTQARAQPARLGGGTPDAPTPQLIARRLDGPVDAEAAFVRLYGASDRAFWLDSAGGDDERARFSFIGDASGPLGAIVRYDVEAGEVRVEQSGEVESRNESIFDFLGAELRRLRLPEADLPFDFDCGFVGWFGYELKAECGGDARHESPLPDAAFLFVDRLIAFDHREGLTYVLCLAEPGGESSAEQWIAGICEALSMLQSLDEPLLPETADGADVCLARSREQYLEQIEECKRRLIAGETYEVCLTNKVLAETGADPLELYRALRRANPAPFAAFLRFGDLSVLSSSPERFLRIGRDREVEAMPVKGTRRRGETPAEDAALAAELASSEKDRAENLMIADLLRNDLGSVCEVGSVHVPSLIEVETQANVHQLVSKIRGRLRGDVPSTECIRACFPPGSMTGAPKRRTMEIIDELEGEPRGIYSGALGYLGLGGTCDLSVVIRTIVLDHGRASIGTGGAIVTQSDPERELEEILLKAAAPLAALDPVTSIKTRRRPLRV